MHVEFRLLGPLEVRVGGRAVPINGRKARTFLVDLLLHCGDVVPIDTLVHDVWPDGAPKGAQHALEAHASKLRAALEGAAAVTARSPGYVLEVDSAAVDAVRFGRLHAEARDSLPSDPARAAARAAEALALWRGEALADVAYDSFAQAEIARLEEQRLEAEETRIDAELALGRAGAVLGELEALVAAEPLRERRRGQLMLALYRTGRQADALAAFRDAREVLLEELGLEPGRELRALERAILQHDESLAGAAPPGAAPRAELRVVSVVAVEPEVSLELDVEAHDRATRRAAGALAEIANEHGAERPEPFLLVFTQEDHAERATAAAHALRDAVRGGIGVASGEALVGDGGVGGPVIARARSNARTPDTGEALQPSAPERAFEGPFVGRESELERLRGATTAVVVGPPGIGKSRLAQELTRDRPAVVGTCTSYGADALAPLREIAASLGAPDALTDVPADEVPSTLRHLCGDLLVVLDDVQWADAVVVDTIEHLAASAVPVLCLGREELLEERPGLLASGERVLLEPLSHEDAEALAAELATFDGPLLERAVDAAEGNPLFIGQLIAHASETGGRLPRTLRSLLTARLDRLTPTERRAIEHAAVVGREFDAALVAELLDASSVRQLLAALVRRGLLEPASPSAAFEDRFRFKHVLIRDAAYDAAPKAERARLHERLADLLDGRGEGDELVGFHLASAAELRPEPDRHAKRLAEDAGRRLAAAGMATWKLGFAAQTAQLLGRASGLLPRDDEQRRELLCELGIARHTAGDIPGADEALEEAVEVAAERSDRRVELRARIERAAVHLLDDSRSQADELLMLTADAIPIFERLGDDRALGRAWMLTGWVQGGLHCRHDAWNECATRALAHYRAAGIPSSTCVAQIAAAVYFGPLPATTGVERCRELLDREVDDRAGEASVLAHLGGLESMLGRFDDAHTRLASARAIYTDLGRPTAVARTCAAIEAAADRLAGGDERAEATLRASCAALEEMNNWTHFVSQAATLADVLRALGRDDEADDWLRSAEARVRRDDTFAQLEIGSVRARLLARAGDHDEAEAIASRTEGLAETTDGLNQQAAVLLALAEVHALAGRSEAAAAAAARARDRYEQKGNVAALGLLE